MPPPLELLELLELLDDADDALDADEAEDAELLDELLLLDADEALDAELAELVLEELLLLAEDRLDADDAELEDELLLLDADDVELLLLKDTVMEDEEDELLLKDTVTDDEDELLKDTVMDEDEDELLLNDTVIEEDDDADEPDVSPSSPPDPPLNSTRKPLGTSVELARLNVIVFVPTTKLPENSKVCQLPKFPPLMEGTPLTDMRQLSSAANLPATTAFDASPVISKVTSKSVGFCVKSFVSQVWAIHREVESFGSQSP